MAEIIKMNENTWRIEDGFVRFFLLTGTEKAVLIDSGMSCPNAKELAQSLTELPILLLNTHGDGDHTSGTAAFDEIHMNVLDYENCGMAANYPNTKVCPVKDGDLYDLGNRTLRIIDNPGHTKGSIAILDVTNRILFAGDSVQTGNIFMFGKHRDPEAFGKSLENLLSYSSEYDTVVASHEKPELQKDQVQKVFDAWKRVQAGEVSYEIIDMFGNKVKSYVTGDCGFFCD